VVTSLTFDVPALFIAVSWVVPALLTAFTLAVPASLIAVTWVVPAAFTDETLAFPMDDSDAFASSKSSVAVVEPETAFKRA
jgi:hypothetical protein